MCWQLVRMNFGDNLTHFGKLGIGLEEAHERVFSDTLYSAWIITYGKLFGKDKLSGLLEDFYHKPETSFRMSSTFIYRVKGGNYIDYLPKPLLTPLGYPGDNQEDDSELVKLVKEYKKISYLPLKVWHRWYQTSEGFTADDREELIDRADGVRIEGGLSKAETFNYKDCFKASLVPKVAIDRATRSTNLYHTGFVRFRSNAGLYFLLYFPSTLKSETQHKLKVALQVLGEQGIGGERSSGAGRFESEWVDLDSAWQKVLHPRDLEKPYYCLVSLYWQKSLSEHLLDQFARYEILERGGWIDSPFSGRQSRRKKIRMFVEGSVFPFQPEGELAIVTPDDFQNNHAIYRSGLSVSIPIMNPS